jgi:hypothetical protein
VFKNGELKTRNKITNAKIVNTVSKTKAGKRRKNGSKKPIINTRQKNEHFVNCKTNTIKVAPHFVNTSINTITQQEK